jgi:hypothetical protein
MRLYYVINSVSQCSLSDALLQHNSREEHSSSRQVCIDILYILLLKFNDRF